MWNQNSLNRRDFFNASAGLAASAILSSVAFAGTEGGASSESSHKHGHGSSGSLALAAAASDCVAKGQACLQHCFDLLVTGDTSMAGCSKSVREMLVYCDALSKAAAQGSKHVAALAKIAMDACKECETECRKHAQKHDVCKQCADACAECYKQCKAIAA